MPATAEPDLLSLLPPGRIEFVPNEPLSEDEFFDLCQQTDFYFFERDPDGTIVISPLDGSYHSIRTGCIGAQLFRWAKTDDSGVAFGVTAGFTLPNGATRSPDASWVDRKRLEHFSKETKEKFLPLAPDFAVEVRFQNDRRKDLEEKMNEYVENGTRLGWLIDPYDETVTVYRDDGTVETHEKPDSLSGDPVLPGFTCDLERVWDSSY